MPRPLRQLPDIAPPAVVANPPPGTMRQPRADNALRARDAEFRELRAAVQRGRTPRGQARLEASEWLRAIERYIRFLIGFAPYVQDVRACKVLSVNTAQGRCTVQLLPSGDTISGVHFDPEPPTVGAQYAARKTVRLNIAMTGGLPELVHWSIKVPTQSWLYYSAGFGVAARVAWPIPNPATQPNDVEGWQETTEIVVIDPAGGNFVGVDGVGRCWFASVDTKGDPCAKGLMPGLEPGDPDWEIIVPYPPQRPPRPTQARLQGCDPTPGIPAGLLYTRIVFEDVVERTGTVQWTNLSHGQPLNLHFGEGYFEFLPSPPNPPGSFIVHEACLLINDLGSVAGITGTPGPEQVCPPGPACGHGDAHWDFYDCIKAGHKEAIHSGTYRRREKLEIWVWRGGWALHDSVPIEGAPLYTPHTWFQTGVDPATPLGFGSPQPGNSGFQSEIPYSRGAEYAYALYFRCPGPEGRSAERDTCLYNTKLYTNGSHDTRWAHELHRDVLPERGLPRQGFIWTHISPGGGQSPMLAVGMRRYPDPVSGVGGPLDFITEAYFLAYQPGYVPGGAMCLRGTSGAYRRNWRQQTSNVLEVRTHGGSQQHSPAPFMTGFFAAGGDERGNMRLIGAWDLTRSGLEVPLWNGEAATMPPSQPVYKRKITSGWEDLGLPRTVQYIYAQSRDVMGLIAVRQNPPVAGTPTPPPAYKVSVNGGAQWYDLPDNRLPAPEGYAWLKDSPGYVVES